MTIVPTVTVILPTYNRAKILLNAVESVLGQTYKYFELLIVDDGSTDDTADVIERIADPRLRYLAKDKNEGQNAALNYGLQHARGKYLAFIDSDDEWLPDFLEKLIGKLEEQPEAGAAYSWAGLRTASGQIVPAVEFSLEGSIYREALAQGYISHMITLVFKRECIELAGPFDPAFTNCQDDDMCLRLAKHYSFALVPEPLAVIGHAEDQVSVRWKDYAEGWYRLFKKFQDDIVKYCGRKQFGQHMLTCMRHFIRGRSIGGIMKSMGRAALVYPPIALYMIGELTRRILGKFGLRIKSESEK